MKRLLYRALRAFSSTQHRLRQRLTPAGWVVLGAAGAAAGTGLDTNQTVIYQAFAFLACLLLVAWLASLFLRRRLELKRVLPGYATAGQPFAYTVEVANRGRRRVKGAALLERFEDPRPSFREWMAARDPGEKRRNWFDRKLGFFRWQWLMQRTLPLACAPSPLEELAPGETRSVKLTMTPRRRGRIHLAGMAVVRREPLGLVNAVASAALPGRVIALPARYRLPEFALPGRRKYHQGGVSLASSIGEAEEFVGLRDYRPGDPMQKIHWRSFARAGKPIVKEHQDEFFERHALLLDTGRSEGEDEVFEAGVALAASFVYTIDTLECLLDLLFVGEKVHAYTTGRGQLPAETLLEVLAGVGPSDPGQFGALARAVSENLSRISSCVLILMAWDSERRAFAERLIGTGLEVRALLVCRPEDMPEACPAWLLPLHPGGIEAGLSKLQ